ncbi:MAG: nuclear transport factor 2 family protein [Acidimicrobiales bacterium]|nr:nuclear transport factor 2 family protein [Acidimicrobiales bacterium]
MDQNEIVAHLEIRQALFRYCRGVDRSDADLIKSAFHPDATDAHGAFKGLGWEMADRLASAEGGMPRVGSHLVTNIYIEFDDADHARCESYVLAFHPHQDTGTPQLGMFAGRYLDRFERRDGEWRIAERLVVNDWSRNHLEGAHWPRGSSQEGGFPPGHKDRQDVAYELFPLP